jgi:hypothetical protein
MRKYAIAPPTVDSEESNDMPDTSVSQPGIAGRLMAAIERRH